MPDRQAYRARVDVRPRFRCLVCRRFVEGTEHGTCPSCGWQPPTTRAVAPRAERDRVWLWGAVLAAAALALVYLLDA